MCFMMQHTVDKEVMMMPKRVGQNGHFMVYLLVERDRTWRGMLEGGTATVIE